MTNALIENLIVEMDNIVFPSKENDGIEHMDISHADFFTMYRSALLQVQADTLEGFQDYLLKHGYCDADVYSEKTPDGHENAIAGYLASLKK